MAKSPTVVFHVKRVVTKGDGSVVQSVVFPVVSVSLKSLSDGGIHHVSARSVVVARFVSRNELA